MTRPPVLGNCGPQKTGLRKAGNRLQIKIESVCKGGGTSTFTAFEEWDFSYTETGCELTFRDGTLAGRKSCGSRVTEIASNPLASSCKVVAGRQPF